MSFRASHAELNAALFALQLLANVSSTAFTPAEAKSKPWMWFTLLLPDDTVWLISPVISLFTAAMIACDIFVPELSLFTEAPALRLNFAVSCILSVSSIMLTNWLRWVHVATLGLLAMWLALLPMYLHSTQAAEVTWLQFVSSHLAVRLYFSWITVIAMLCVSLSWQTHRGGFLSFGEYALKLAVLLTIVISGIVYRHDNVIGVVAMWTLLCLTACNRPFKPAPQGTLDMIQPCAFVGLLVIAMTMAVAALHRQLSPQWIPLTVDDISAKQVDRSLSLTLVVSKGIFRSSLPSTHTGESLS